uniref:Uncharacterized protein n=1 Tax=Oryza nivara TaxID=4536 RepID=A0A0E0J192_ORYNI
MTKFRGGGGAGKKLQHAHKMFDEMCRRVKKRQRGEDELVKAGRVMLIASAAVAPGRRSRSRGRPPFFLPVVVIVLLGEIDLLASCRRHGLPPKDQS